MRKDLLRKIPLPGLLQMPCSAVGKTSARRAASEDAVLVSCPASAGLWNTNLPAADHKDDTDVAEVAFV